MATFPSNHSTDIAAQSIIMSKTTPEETYAIPLCNPGQRDRTQCARPDGTRRSFKFERNLPPEANDGTYITKQHLPDTSEDTLCRDEDIQLRNDNRVLFNVPSQLYQAAGMSSPSAAAIQTTLGPEDIRRLLGVPEFQPKPHQPTYTGQRNYNYEDKYQADKPGEEHERDARFFKVYLDEAETFDHDKIRSHRDNLDSLLVFAALFSAVVTTLVVETSQALRPDQNYIANHLLLYQIEILKVAGNISAIAEIPASQFLPDSPTHSRSDVWVNGLFLTSLSLSISTALLSVLAKQWLQAYDSSTSGSARNRALVRQLRFMGLMKWKLDEIVGALPLILHASVAVFLIGLVVFLRALYPVLSWVVITTSAICFTLYFASVILPAVDIECPYRIPLLYRPTRYLVIFVSWVLSFLARLLPFRVPRPFFGSGFISSIPRYLQKITILPATPPSLKDAEQASVRDTENTCRYLHQSISWLHAMTSNKSVRRVASQAVAGSFCDPWAMQIYPIEQASGTRRSPFPSRLAEIAAEGLFDGEDVPSKGPDGYPHSSWTFALNNLRMTSSKSIITTEFSKDIYTAAERGRVNHVEFILDYGIDVNQQLDGKTPLCVASHSGHLPVIKLLLERGADVNLGMGWYGTPLQAATKQGYTDVVLLLLEKGANVNGAGGGYGSALHVASAYGRLRLVQLLLEKGADVSLDSGTFGTALQIAVKHGHWEIVELLRKRGAI